MKSRTSELIEQLQNAIILDLQDNEVACPRCRGLRFYYIERNGKAFMESCCACHVGKLYICEYCGTLNKTDYCGCEEARNKRDEERDKLNYERAEKLTPEQYDGWIYKKGYGYNEGYFEDTETLEQYCEDEEIEIPEWVYCCESQTHTLDIDTAIEQMLDDAFEDARNYLKDENELYDFIDKWNAKQNLVSYYPDYTKIVVLKKEY